MLLWSRFDNVLTTEIVGNESDEPSKPDPEYTEEARRAKTQGTCNLWLIVDAAGHPRDIRVIHGLGFGLDAKAMEAVKQWRFDPALKDGRPVSVQISVEVEFRLY
jgi:protein TonB